MKNTVALMLDSVGPFVALAAAMIFAHLAFAQSPATSSQPPPAAKSAAPAGAAAQSPVQPPAQTSKEMPAGHPPAGPAGTTDTKGATAPVKKVDLNNASLAELKTLPMINDEYAKIIVAHRPYTAKGELVTKAGLPEGVYVAVRRKVILLAPKKSAPKQPAPKS